MRTVLFPSGPPSACRNIKANLIGDRRIDVFWERPTFTGRNDFYYILEWVSLTPPSVVSPTSESILLFDRNMAVSHTITGLMPETEYNITVTVFNGVSDQDDLGNEDMRRCQLVATTLEGSFCKIAGSGNVITYE